MRYQQEIEHFSRDGVLLSRAVASIAFLLFQCTLPSAHAADWELLPRISVGAFTDDNYTMNRGSEEPVDIVGAQGSVEFPLRATTQLTTFTIAPQLDSTYVPDDDQWNSTDGFLRLDWKHTRQRFAAGLRADYADETTVHSELPSSDVNGDLGEPAEGDSGIVTVDNRRQQLRVKPSVSFAITQRSTLVADAGYDGVDYDQQNPGGNVGFSESNVSLGYGFNFSPTSSLVARGMASRYERDSDSVETDSYSVLIEWHRRVSDISRWYLRAGASEVDVPESLQTPGGSTSETGFEGGIGADWAFQVTKLFIDATASVEPNSSGRLIEREQFRLRLMRQFGPRSSGFLGARASRDRALSEDLGTFRDRDYATGTLGFEWRMSREFSLIGQYDIRWQEFEDDPSDATSNAFLLSIAYERRRGD